MVKNGEYKYATCFWLRNSWVLVHLVEISVSIENYIWKCSISPSNIMVQLKKGTHDHFFKQVLWYITGDWSYDTLKKICACYSWFLWKFLKVTNMTVHLSDFDNIIQEYGMDYIMVLVVELISLNYNKWCHISDGTVELSGSTLYLGLQQTTPPISSDFFFVLQLLLSSFLKRSRDDIYRR